MHEKGIVVAHDLSPAETAQMVKSNIMGFANDMGGKTSHTAIMAKSLKIPAVLGLEKITQIANIEDFIIVDGTGGVVILNPDQATIEEYQVKQKEHEYFEKTLFKYSKLPAETKDGFRVKICANIELIEEIPSVLKYGAEGIGLYRTEFLYLNRAGLPTEKEHFEAYKKVLEKISPCPATIRTLDIGGDKFLSPVNLAEEMNPALGLRAIRFCLKEMDIFKVQLKSILKASVYGKLRILFPMISGIEEIREVKEILEEVKDELRKKKIPFDEKIEIGIMIEIPSAVVIADILAREVDFFSIGTNDLIQYSLAIDRVNEHVNYLYDPLHPAVLRLIKNVVDTAHKAGITIAMCGEMAGESLYIPILLGLGLNELSMDPPSIPRAKKIIRSTTIKESKQLLENILSFSTTDEIENFIKTDFIKRFPDEFSITGLPAPL
jgi:phosphotransferase system enzyme I (PtsI)